MKLGKKTFPVLLMLLLILAMMPIQAFAAGPIMPKQNITLNISYIDGTKAISNARFRIYKVADVDEYARMTLTSDFEAYKGTVTGMADLEHLTQKQWSELAFTLKGYVQKVTPAAEGKTDSDGKLSISNLDAELYAGLYLVIGNRVSTSDRYSYSVDPFMIFLPGEDLENNEWDYEVTVAPKFSRKYNPPDDDDKYISRKVLKQWDDAGNEALRPTEVVVQLLRDGDIYDTQTLNKENNWRYAWDNLDPDYEWDIVENEVDGYTSTISRSGITFIVTNTYTPEEPNPPDNPNPPDEPGDEEGEENVPHNPRDEESEETEDTPLEKLPQTGLLWWPVPILLCAGLISIMIGVIRRRRYN